MSIPNHLDVVKRARAVYNDRSGTDRAHAICAFVTWELRVQPEGSWGRFLKGDGVTLSADVIGLRVTNQTWVDTYDILGDSEGAAVPQWGPTTPTGRGDLTRWRAAVPPPDPSPQPPTPEPEPPPTGDYVTRAEFDRYRLAQEARLHALEERVALLEVAPDGITLDEAVQAVVDGVVVDQHETGRASWPPHRHGIDPGVALKRK